MQNFISAAVGIVVVVALIRGIVARSGVSSATSGRTWSATLLYILLPISIIGALFLVSQGVIQNLGGASVIHTLTGGTQILAQGPVASQEAIKELGTNGGGFFNVNSAYPFENPSGLTNFFEMLLILIIPAGLTYTYGRMVGSQRQGWAIFAAMFVLFIAGVIVVYIAEQHGTPAQHAAGLHTHAFNGSTGGNMEGKEQRFGVAGTSLWAAITTVTSCGAVNGALESLTGLGQLVPFSNLSLSEVVFGGVGTGLYSMLLYVILAVFIGGLMVGRTPEYLGKKIQAREIKLVSLGVLVTPLVVLLSSGLASATRARHPLDLRRHQPAGLLRDPLRLPLAGQQQRLRAGRLHRLHPAQRARQRRRLRDQLRRPARRRGDGDRPLPADPLRPRRRRRPGGQEGLARRPGDDADRQPDLRDPADRHRDPGRRPHLLPRPPARTGGPEPDHEALLMKKDLRTGLIAIVVMTLFLGLAYPLAITGISQLVFPGHANGSKVSFDGKVVGSKLIGQEFTEPVIGKNGKPVVNEEGEEVRVRRQGLLPAAPLGDRLLRQRHLLRQRRPEQRRSARRSPRIHEGLPPPGEALRQVADQ